MSGQSLGHERAPSAYERCPHGYLRAISPCSALYPCRVATALVMTVVRSPADAGRTSGRAVPRSTGRSVLGQCTVDGCGVWDGSPPGWPFEPGDDLGPAPCPARSGHAGTPCCPPDPDDPGRGRATGAARPARVAREGVVTAQVDQGVQRTPVRWTPHRRSPSTAAEPPGVAVPGRRADFARLLQHGTSAPDTASTVRLRG